MCLDLPGAFVFAAMILGLKSIEFYGGTVMIRQNTLGCMQQSNGMNVANNSSIDEL